MDDQPIDLAEEPTWPTAVRDLLAGNLAMLEAFEAERRDIDARMNSDVLVRVNPPLNPHAEPRTALIADINAAIAGRVMLAWHCTRLLPHERAALQAGGLQRHTRALFETRIANAVAAGFLQAALGKSWLANGQVAEHGRDDLLHLILNRQALADESDVIDLLRNWGGEAIYNNAGRDSDSAALRIGTAAIVEVALPLGWLELPRSVGEQILSRYLDLNGITTEHGWWNNAKLRRDLPGSMVRRVILPDDAAFEELTGASNWIRSA